MDGHADRARLVGERARDRLADPPGRVGRELVAAAPVELLDRADQARACPPGSGRGTAGPGCGSSSRSRRRGAGSTGSSAASPACRRARSSWRARPPAAAVSSGCRPVSRRKSCSASVVVSSGAVGEAGRGGSRSSALPRQARSPAPRTSGRRRRPRAASSACGSSDLEKLGRVARSPRPRRPRGAGLSSSVWTTLSIVAIGASNMSGTWVPAPATIQTRSLQNVERPQGSNEVELPRCRSLAPLRRRPTGSSALAELQS